ncbi:hypothetical protein LCGC14_1908740 [marine sediment metagenome]|uniref:Uncharacterized protein n=1 Tax=marine sediment metagenome TaxID=412755 RepID=A0A0F9FUB9_9ZZZZ
MIKTLLVIVVAWISLTAPHEVVDRLGPRRVWCVLKLL